MTQNRPFPDRERVCFSAIIGQKGREHLDAKERLIRAGIRPDCAAETVHWFAQQGDEDGLERYILEKENRKVEVSCR